MAKVAPSARLTPPKVGLCRRTQITPLVSVVIVNYCRWTETAALVEQLLARQAIYHDRVEIIVIDNASRQPDGIAPILHDPRVTLRRLRENRGFSAGVNAGAALSQAPWILVLNPDVIVCPGFVDRLYAAAVDVTEDVSQGNPIGVVGFGLRNRDGSRQLSAGQFPSLGRMVLGLLKPRRSRKYVLPYSPERHSASWVTGSCMLLRKECLRSIGGFDEDYFLYYEDVDVCRRASLTGWAVCFDPALEAVHLDPLQNRQLTATMRAVTRHASLVYFSKHLPGWPTWGLAQLIRAEAGLKGLLAWLRGRRQESFIAGQVWAYCDDFIKGRVASARRRLESVLRRAGLQRAEPGRECGE